MGLTPNTLWRCTDCLYATSCLEAVLHGATHETHCEAYMRERGLDPRDSKQRLPDDELIDIWRTSDTLEEAVTRAGIKKETLQKRISKLRKAGHELKSYGRKHRSAEENERFREIWQASDHIEDVEAQFGGTRAALVNRAYRQRKAGFELKKLTPRHVKKRSKK